MKITKKIYKVVHNGTVFDLSLFMSSATEVREKVLIKNKSSKNEELKKRNF